MNYNEIIKLLDAGYSREEILQMDSKEPEPAPEPEPDPEPEPAPSMDSIMSEVKDMFAEMRKELTAMNIMNSRLQDDHNEPEDILAQIINPTKNTNGGITK